VADVTDQRGRAAQLGLFRTWPTLVADPPWPFDDPGIRGGVGRHYDVMSLDDIAAMPVWRYVGDSGHLYLWLPNAHLIEGVGARVCRAWGFEPKTVITWDKMLFGTGHYYRNQTEHCIFAVRGTSPIQVSNLPTIIRHRRRRHSEKPAEFYYMVEEASPGPYLELFARRQRGIGWSCWGNELASPVSLPELDRAALRAA
jgi:N6-adenosine-specific RNA methylase IME4